MKKLKFVHCADIHLDAPFKEHGTGKYAEIRRQDIKKALLNILKIVKDNNADILLISGDLYEHQYIARKTMDWLYMVLSEVKVPVIAIPGNHDPYLQNSFYRTWEWPSNVHILSPERPHLILEQQGVSLFGLGFASFKEDKPDFSEVPLPLNEYFNILILHGTLDMDFTGQMYKPVTTAELRALNYDYYALGHFHAMKQDYNIINPGSPEPLGFDEHNAHGAYLVTLTKEEGRTMVESQFLKTAQREYHEKNLDITGCKTPEEVKIRMIEITEGLNPERDLVRITLKGRTDLALDPKALSMLFPGWLYFEIRDDTRRAFDLDALEKDPSLKGAYVREIRQRVSRLEADLEKEPDNEKLKEEIERLNLALYYGLEALNSGKIEWWGEL